VSVSGAAAGAGSPAAAGVSATGGAVAAPAGGAEAAGAGGGPAVAASGAGAAGAASVPAVGSDCDVDPLAGKAPYGSGFTQQFRGLFGCTEPADLALFRSMLPEKFEMPAAPEVCFYFIDFIVGSVGPYHEAALLLPATYAGQSGKYVLTMGLDSFAATSGGRALGFPKYMAEVALQQNGNDWTGTVSANGQVDLKASYTGQCHKDDAFPWPDFFNLTPIPASETSSQAFVPPRTGSVLRVPAKYLTAPAFYSLQGTVRLEIGDHVPWHGLIDTTKPFPALLTTFVGGIDLGNQPLD
jgi:hypothetical protein